MRESKSYSILITLLLALIVLAGLQMRLQAVMQTEVSRPIRADAKDYFSYAYNLKFFSCYSRQLPTADNKQPVPDAVRPPGYPLFLTLFVQQTELSRQLKSICIAQALIGTLTVLLCYLVFCSIAGKELALLAAALAAVSPHLINGTVYILSEVWFGFSLMVSFWALSFWQQGRNRLAVLVVAGLLLGFTALTRPWIQYYVVLLVALMCFSVQDKVQRWRPGLVLFLSFALVLSLWMLRNIIVLDSFGDSTLVSGTLHHGMYPDFMFQGQKNTLAYPYRHDPRSAIIGQSLGSVLTEIYNRFRTDFSRHFVWYVWGKTNAVFSWNLIQGFWGGYIYPVIKTPYMNVEHFQLTYYYMHRLHVPIMILSMLGTVAAWLPLKQLRFNPQAVFMVRSVSLLLVYFILMHILAAPFPRYSIPLRPLSYGMSAFFISFVWRLCWMKRSYSFNGTKKSVHLD